MSTATITLPASVLTKKQVKTFGPVEFHEGGRRYRVRAEVRYDDSCGNGHNTFSITGTVSEFRGRRFYEFSWGQCVDAMKHIKELRPLLKWHLCSSDGPMHYVANTLYHAKEGKFDYARSSAIWPDASDADLLGYETDQGLKAKLLERLPALMAEFKAAVESLGMVY